MGGQFIVFEGIEGCGKTTQLARAQQWLTDNREFSMLQAKGWLDRVIVTREPGGTDLGRDIRQLLLHSSDTAIQERAELLLYAADRAQHVSERLRPQLAKGALILCDRYTDSTIAYQGYGRGLDLDLIRQINQIATGGLQSDLTLWLDLPVAEGLARMNQRGQQDRMEQADVAFHQRVYQGFAQLAQQEPQQVVRVDASGSEDEVADRIKTILSQFLGKLLDRAEVQVD